LQEGEDECNRAAFDQDRAIDQVYMNQLMEQQSGISIDSVVREVHDNYAKSSRNSRADCSATCQRLKEQDVDVPRRPHNSPTEVDPNLKSILKRRDTEDNPGPKKRVRFDPEFKEGTKIISHAVLHPTGKDDKVAGSDCISLIEHSAVAVNIFRFLSVLSLPLPSKLCKCACFYNL
jgi:hypothetical protein